MLKFLFTFILGFVLFASPYLRLASAQEIDVNLLNKVSAQVTSQKIILNLEGFFNNITDADLLVEYQTDTDLSIVLRNTIIDTSLPSTIKFPTVSYLIDLSLIDSVVEEVTPVADFDDEGNLITQNSTPSVTEQFYNTSFETQLSLKTSEKLEIINKEIAPDRVIITLASESVIANPLPTTITIAKNYFKPDKMSIAILHKKPAKKKAYSLSNFLLKTKKAKIEWDLDLKFNIVNISNTPLNNYKRNVVYFEDNYYLPAVYLTSIFQSPYVMMPFPPQMKRKGTDLMIIIVK